MNKPDLDALEKLLVTEAADPFAFVEAAPALLAMARRTERLETELHNYETNHGARCDAEQERYATIAESACRILKAEADRLDTMLGSNEFSARIRTFLSLPAHEVPGLCAKLAACDAALGACAARIAELLAQVGAWKQAAQQVVDLFDPLKTRVAIPRDAVIIATAAKTAHLAVRAERDEARAEADKWRCAGFDGIDNMAEAIGRMQRERDEAQAALAEARASTRPRLDPVHVAVLRGMLEDERDDLVHISKRTHPMTIAKARSRIAALEAVLGEEARGQALPDVGTTERA